MLSCSIWFSAPSFWMGGGLESHTIRVIKSRSMKWAEHVEHMGERRGVFRVLVGNPREETIWKTQA